MRKFVLKEPEAHYKIPLTDDLMQQEIDDWIRDRDIVGYRTKVIIAGKMISLATYPVWKTQKNNERANRHNPTRDVQIILNQKNAEKKLINIINTNFVRGDVWLHLSYDEQYMPKTEAQAKANVRNLIRRLKYYCRAHGMPDPKIVCVFGHDDTKEMRFHFHIVTDFRDRDFLESLWEFGRTKAERLQPDEFELTGMATYMGHHLGAGKRYSISKNIKMPKEYIDNRGLSRRKVNNLRFNQEAAPQEIIKYLNKRFGIDCKILEYPKFMASDYVTGVYMYARLRIKESLDDKRSKAKSA